MHRFDKNDAFFFGKIENFISDASIIQRCIVIGIRCIVIFDASFFGENDASLFFDASFCKNRCIEYPISMHRNGYIDASQEMPV